MLRRVAAIRGIENAKIDQAYAILVKSAHGGQASQDQARRELVALVGAEPAAEIMKAYEGPRQALTPARPGVATGTLLDGRLFRMPPGAQPAR